MYQIRLNIPHQDELTIIEVSKEKFRDIKPELEIKQLLEIDGYVFNTAYFVDAIYIRSEEEKMLLLTNYRKNETTMAQKDNQ